MLRNQTLRNEFPAFEVKIGQLKKNDAHFKKLFDEYEDLNHHLHGLETEMNTTD